jgi:F0F1-type ATP synthase assembly protein I
MIEFFAGMQSSGAKSPAKVLTAAQVVGLIAQSGCLVFGVVLAMVIGGIALDRTLGTRPLFTLLLLLGSAPLTMLALFRFAMHMVGRARNLPPAAGKSSDVDDDES